MSVDRSRFPKCEWHGELVEHKLFDGCPFTCESPFDGVMVYRLKADHKRRTQGVGQSDARLNENHADVCMRCVERIGYHPVIKKLREERREKKSWALKEIDGPCQCSIAGTGAKTTYEVWRAWKNRNKAKGSDD